MTNGFTIGRGRALKVPYLHKELLVIVLFHELPQKCQGFDCKTLMAEGRTPCPLFGLYKINLRFF